MDRRIGFIRNTGTGHPSVSKKLVFEFPNTRPHLQELLPALGNIADTSASGYLSTGFPEKVLLHGSSSLSGTLSNSRSIFSRSREIRS